MGIPEIPSNGYLNGQLITVCSTSPSYLCTDPSHKSFLIAMLSYYGLGTVTTLFSWLF